MLLRCKLTTDSYLHYTTSHHSLDHAEASLNINTIYTQATTSHNTFPLFIRLPSPRSDTPILTLYSYSSPPLKHDPQEEKRPGFCCQAKTGTERKEMRRALVVEEGLSASPLQIAAEERERDSEREKELRYRCVQVTSQQCDLQVFCTVMRSFPKRFPLSGVDLSSRSVYDQYCKPAGSHGKPVRQLEEI